MAINPETNTEKSLPLEVRPVMFKRIGGQWRFSPLPVREGSALLNAVISEPRQPVIGNPLDVPHTFSPRIEPFGIEQPLTGVKVSNVPGLSQ